LLALAFDLHRDRNPLEVDGPVSTDDANRNVDDLADSKMEDKQLLH
jgi:hypothetical protein